MVYKNLDVNENITVGGGLLSVLSELFNIVLVLQYSEKKNARRIRVCNFTIVM
jgi:hypothetical protein